MCFAKTLLTMIITAFAVRIMAGVSEEQFGELNPLTLPISPMMYYN